MVFQPSFSAGVAARCGPGLSASSLQLLDVLLQVPLASAMDLERFCGRSIYGVRRSLRELEEAGLVEFSVAGYFHRPVRRYWLTEVALEGCFLPETRLHLGGGLLYLFSRLGVVESFYELAGSESRLGVFSEFLWFDGVSFDAAARYEGGWIMFFWSGLCQSETYLRRRLQALAPQVRSLSLHVDFALPSFFYFVCSDLWQLQLCHLVCDSVSMGDRFYGVTHSKSFSLGGIEPSLPSGWLLPSIRARAESPSLTFGSFVSRSYWATPRESAYVIAVVLELVAQWPGISPWLLNRLFGPGVNRKRTRQVVQELLGREFLAEVPVGGKTGFVLGREAEVWLRGRDAVPASFRFPSLRSTGGGGLRLQHELGVLNLMVKFAEGYAPVAVGTRYLEMVSGAGRMAPDGVVYLVGSPLGPSWHFVEYERRASGAVRVAAKMRFYVSRLRRNRWPVLMVCATPAVEALFWEAGASGVERVPMLTSTVSRVRMASLVDVEGVWSYYGQPVVIRSV